MKVIRAEHRIQLRGTQVQCPKGPEQKVEKMREGDHYEDQPMQSGS